MSMVCYNIVMHTYRLSQCLFTFENFPATSALLILNVSEKAEESYTQNIGH